MKVKYIFTSLFFLSALTAGAVDLEYEFEEGQIKFYGIEMAVNAQVKDEEDVVALDFQFDFDLAYKVLSYDEDEECAHMLAIMSLANYEPKDSPYFNIDMDQKHYAAFEFEMSPKGEVEMIDQAVMDQPGSVIPWQMISAEGLVFEYPEFEVAHNDMWQDEDELMPGLVARSMYKFENQLKQYVIQEIAHVACPNLFNMSLLGLEVSIDDVSLVASNTLHIDKLGGWPLDYSSRGLLKGNISWMLGDDPSSCEFETTVQFKQKLK